MAVTRTIPTMAQIYLYFWHLFPSLDPPRRVEFSFNAQVLYGGGGAEEESFWRKTRDDPLNKVRQSHSFMYIDCVLAHVLERKS